MTSACLIFNPAAGRGRIRARIAEIRAAFAARGIRSTYETRAPGDEEKLAARAISEGARTIVAVGGDGTCGRIANAIVNSGKECTLAVVPCGTGNDFAKTLGVTELGPTSIAALVESTPPTLIDVGWADGTHFLNSCGFGFDASVLEASYSVKLLKGDAVYIYSALRQLFTYQGVDVQPSGLTAIPRSRMLMITASNGRYLGGAFKIAPNASVVDGKLDVCFFGDSNVVNRVRLFVGAMRGTHLQMPGVSAVTTDHFTLSFRDPPAMEMDGELRIATGRSVELKCFRRALSVIAAPRAIL